MIRLALAVALLTAFVVLIGPWPLPPSPIDETPQGRAALAGAAALGESVRAAAREEEPSSGERTLVGLGRREIAAPLGPEAGVLLGGYGIRAGIRPTPSLDVDPGNPCAARALVFETARGLSVVLAADLLYVAVETRRRVLEALARDPGIPAERVMFTATHSHSAPGEFAGGPAEAVAVGRFREEVVAAIVHAFVDATRDAAKGLAPATLSVARASVPAYTRNRYWREGERDPPPPLDADLTVLLVREPVAGPSAPPQGPSLPPQGPSVPPQGTSPPPQGTSPPPQGPSPPPQGTSPPPQGTSAPPQGTSPPPQGTSAPPQGTSAPPQGPSAPLQGRLRGVFAVYGAHGTCIGPWVPRVSGDWPGALSAALERAHGAGAIALVAAGPVGSQAPSPPEVPHDAAHGGDSEDERGFHEARAMGEALAIEVARLVAGAAAGGSAGPSGSGSGSGTGSGSGSGTGSGTGTGTGSGSPSAGGIGGGVASGSAPVLETRELPLPPVLFRLAPGWLASPLFVRWIYPTPERAPFSALRIGSDVFLAVPCEVSGEVSLAMKAAAARAAPGTRLTVTSFAGHYHGYVPPDECYPRFRYENTLSLHGERHAAFLEAMAAAVASGTPAR